MNKESNWYKNKKGYNSEYTRTHYEQVYITLPKGSKSKYQNIAKSQGLSASQFFLKSIEEYMRKHNIEGDIDG